MFFWTDNFWYPLWDHIWNFSNLKFSKLGQKCEFRLRYHKPRLESVFITPTNAKDSGNERFSQNTLTSKQIRSKNIGNSQSYSDLNLERNFHFCGKSPKSLRFCQKSPKISSFSILEISDVIQEGVSKIIGSEKHPGNERIGTSSDSCQIFTF